MDLNNELNENNVEGNENIDNNEINNSNETENNNNSDNNSIDNNEINSSNETENNNNTDNNEAIAMENIDKKEEGEEDYKEKYTELKDQLLRNIAEFDNYKKRSENEMDNAKNIGKAELFKNLLSIIDEFDLTLLAVSESQEKNLLKGVELLYSNFIVELKKNGLEEIKSEGIFDPYKHEILITKASSEPKDTILETIKKGYMFNKIMLRPASVITSKGEKQNKTIKEE